MVGKQAMISQGLYADGSGMSGGVVVVLSLCRCVGGDEGLAALTMVNEPPDERKGWVGDGGGG